MTATTVVIAVLALAALSLAVGVARGSYRWWLLGYALVVAGLVVVYARIHTSHAASPAVQESTDKGARS